MTEEDIKVNWYYFRSLAKQLYDTEQFVDHSIDSSGNYANGSAFSNEFAKILMLSSSEFEVIGRQLCAEACKPLPEDANIIKISREILGLFPSIGETVILTPYQAVRPLKNWKIVSTPNQTGIMEDKVYGISWWFDHNNVKHNRRETFAKANLHNCVYSMASLMVLELYLSWKVIGNLDAITTIHCEYFDCEYGLGYVVDSMKRKLPDFV